MARVRSVDFLPQIFQTETNKQFLAATLDQLIQEPKFKKTQGFIGRTVGPGVNPNDKYVVEPTKTRSDYQLEPGVVSLDPADTTTIKNTITYPGMLDALEFQGSPTQRPDRLFSSDYYTWDPFINFDTFVNFSQYFWLPNGPNAVDVAATGVPVTDDFEVTRANGVYTFSGISGENPTIEVVRGGSYTFQVAQNSTETVNYRVGNSGISAYTIDFLNNPTLTLARGNTYVFNLNLQGDFPFWIKTEQTLGSANPYNDGVSRNGSNFGLVTFTVPRNAPNTLYYVSGTQPNMRGTLNIVDGTPGTGPGFWIQTDPGVSGKIPTTPNISSRDVFGVTNNGEDLGTVIFNVPTKTAQSFYYNLPVFSQTVDLLTELQFEQINNQPLDTFIETYGGIDGITSLNNRTLIFTNSNTDAESGGWIQTSFFDPLEAGSANNGLIGSFDTEPFSYTAEIAPEDRYQLWQINYVVSDGITYLRLSRIATIDNLNKWTIRYGTVYSSTNWYKDAAGTFRQIPLLTALLNTLYYQDGTDPEIFGTIKLLDETESSTLFIDDILGQKNYTSPNGVSFTNGLKIVFRGDVIPTSYSSGTISFVCTSTNAGFNTISTATTEDLYVGQRIVFTGTVIGGLVAGQSYYVQSIVNSFQFTVSSVVDGSAVTLTTATADMNATAINYREYYVAGVGTAIELLPVTNFVTPESYVINDNDSSLPVPEELDYFTIDRASQDLNPWTRSNRWFHIDVINATAAYNNTVATLDNNYRGKRPIIQFRPDIRLFNMGTQGKQPVDIIDQSESDAFSNIQGSTGYSVDGYTFTNGTRVIFAADEDPDVRDKIYVVEFIVPDTVPPLIAQPIINLTLASDGEVLTDQSTLCLSGDTLQGLTFWYDGAAWIEAQQKTGVQQAPLFDVYDADQVSFGNQAKYPSSDFIGSKLFSYAVGDTGILDTVLKIPLRYLSISNVGDIVFDNNLYKDTFVYTRDNVSVTVAISSGSAREYADRTAYTRLIGWQNAITTTQMYQQFKFTYNTGTLKLDIPVIDQTGSSVPVVKVYVGSVFQDPTKYTYVTSGNNTTITLLNTYVVGDIIEVLVLSDQISAAAFYQVPSNLQNNPLNANSTSFTLGTIRQNYESICENLPGIQGTIAGANNTRDLGNIIPYGLTILQQSAPMTLAGYFLRSEEYNIFNALTYNSREYLKFKNIMLDNVTQQEINFQTTAQILDTAIEEINAGKVETQPFYWSDMLPSGAVYTENTYTVSFITSSVFDTVQVYNYTSANYLGLDVYLNNRLLTRDLEYTVATDGPRVTILITLSVGDQIAIREYTTTYGNFVPNTPTKLGLYPAFRPRITVQQTSTGEQTVLIGHDGSVTKTFDDIRDDVLLEFETRIFNNLKLDGNPVPLAAADVIPGQFRDTGFTYSEVNNILSQDFLSWVAWNKLDYKTQDYQANNEFTWNYSEAQNKLNNDYLLGAWRGIYRYFYDTQQPEYTPWEMLGLSVKPDWWDDTYGPAPYTEGNLVLWDDMEAGYVRDPLAPYYLPKYARPGLTSVIPTGGEGALLSPFNSVVGTWDAGQFRKSWSIGDGGPVEASWWNSSSYPFAVMRLLALTQPAKFFALFADRDLYRYQEEFGQYLYDGRYRLDANGIEIYGNGVSKASYIDWIVDYNRQSGIDSTEDLTADLTNLDVRLCYRMASFSDKKYIKLYTEKSSPASTNTSFLIPDESYNLLLYKNQPFDRASYSSVLVQTVPGGYAVFGYSTSQPYFSILQSQNSGQLRTITVLDTRIQVPTSYTNTVVQVPYGFIFDTKTAVVDFLLSLGQYLETQGLTFTNRANGYELDWNQMANEFLYWAAQGWSDDALIALNPLAFRLSVTKEQAVVDSIQAQTSENILLDQNRRELPTRQLNIVRIDNTFSVEPLADQTLSFIDIKYTSYEHMIVLDNASVFGDLIYDPVTGARQNRLNLISTTSTEWNGAVDAQGFILNQDNVEEWQNYKIYSKGTIVKYKGTYWSAMTIVQPSETFDYNNWVQSDYSHIELGLLPNLANKANQLANSYDINAANLESDNDLLSYGLIGFRPRQYMAALNLDDVSQVNIYRQFLDSKGTILSAELFSQAVLGKETGDYNIYENWAVQRAVYGANANRSYFELRLNRALLDASPSLVQVILPLESSKADQTVLLENVWKESFKLTSPNILPTTTELPTDTALPSAGYVNLDDADITVFDIDDPASLEANINNINVGTSIWVAKVNDYDWNIYRAETVPGTISHVCDNLNNTSRVIFTADHGLVAGNRIVIRFFDTEVDGVYDVLSVVNLNTINIAFRFLSNRTVVNGTGLAFTLKTMRVSQASDVDTLPYANSLLFGAKVWVDDNGDGLWQVIEKQNIFSEVTSIAPEYLDATEAYGSSVSQATNRFAALVGSPRYGFPTSANPKGGVYTYVRSTSDVYQPASPVSSGDALLTLDISGVRAYGTSVKFGNKDWAVAGAPLSLGSASQTNNGYACVIYRDTGSYLPDTNPYFNWQLLTTPGSVSADQGRFGYSVAMSLDERWMYIGAPDLNRVYAYGRVDWEDQYFRTVGNGSTKIYLINDYITISAATQLRVTVDGEIQTLNTDYTVNAALNTVTFVSAPVSGSDIIIRRIALQDLDGADYFSVTATGGSGSGALFTVSRRRGTVTVGVQDGGTGYTVGNTLTIPATSFGGGTVPANNITFTVGSVISGEIITINTPSYTPPALATVFSLNEYFYQVALTDSTIYSFQIEVDGVLQRPNIDYTFNTSTKDITFLNSPASGTSILARAKDYWLYVDTLTAGGLAAGAQFGYSVSCSTDGRQVMIGAPYASADGETEAGVVYVFDRNVQKFIWNNDPSSSSFTVLGTPVAPVSVIVNNQFLTNQNSTTQDATNTFTISGSTVTVNLENNLQSGDIVEIETNQFELLQIVTQDAIAEFSNFGQSVDLCKYNCSLYVGEPQSSIQIYKGGVVERSVNQSRVYGVITALNANPALTAGNTLRVNNMDVVVPVAPNNTVTGLAAAINTVVPNVTATVTSGLLTISVTNFDSAPVGNKLQVAPGSIGTAFDSLGFNTFEWTQTIQSPYPVKFAGFGTSISVDDTATTLVVGAPRGTMYLITIFDDYVELFDAGATSFFTTIDQSGAVYTYDLLNSANSSIINPSKFIFGNQIAITSIDYLDQLGVSVDYTSGVLWMGAPGTDFGDSSSSNYGQAHVWQNATRSPAWVPIRVEQPVVDVRLLNSVFLYDRISSATTEFLDFFNPLQGKILGAARQNIDYIGAVDPGSYNVGPVGVRGTTWGAEHVGEIWWDISAVRFIDPNQDDIVYASRRWGQVFPGSSIDVYQWSVSSVPPATYVGPGTPYSTSSYTINTVLSRDGNFNTQYFFWVRGITDVATQKNKTLSATTISQYIENPRSTGIAYLAPINSSTVALYNCETLIEAEDTILHVEFDRELTNANVHVEYELIAQGRADGFLSGNLYRKLQDSFCGVDTAGNIVPDINLGPAERYGVQFRPRQSMFVDRFAALKNYIVRANTVLKQYTISESRSFALLNSAEPELPSTQIVNGATVTNWNKRIPNLEILIYNFEAPGGDAIGYKYLVVSDSDNRGLWTIYTVEENPNTGDPELVLSRVQNYRTTDYWSYIDWYRPGYNSSIKPVAEVPTYSSLATISVTTGASVKVTANAQGKFEIYLKTDLGFERVGLEGGTIAISAEIYDYALGRFGFDVEVFDAQYFDQEPVIETRKIIQAINEELFIDDLAIERNRSLTLMFDFILSEFAAPEWLVKTSLIDVDHRIRELLPFQNYSRDNQEFVIDYLQEVKPYHVQVREFNLTYFGNDLYQGDLTDFDVPAFYNTTLPVPQYTSPILLPYAHSAAQISNTLSDAESTDQIWTEWPYSQWYNNYLLSVDTIVVTFNGTGYTTAPQVTIVGDAVTPAEATALINSAGQVVAINVTNPGSGYQATPTIVFSGGNGTGAQAYANMINRNSADFDAQVYNVNPAVNFDQWEIDTNSNIPLTTVRAFKTVIKYDRYQYQTSVQTWSSTGIYLNGTLVRYDDRVWSADSSDGSSAVVGPTFDLEDWVEVDPGTLSGVDRTMGYYVSGVNSPGLELPLLIDGVDYPGVQVWGDYFLGTEIVDAQYESEFTDTELGLRNTDVNVDGGEFIGPYEGHAPEELVNGSEFDTLDIRVYTRPGSDWQMDGHGFQIGVINYVYDPATSYILSWSGVVDHPVQVLVSNQTSGRTMTLDVDYYINWGDETVEIIPSEGFATDDVVNISVYELGGGNQLYRDNYTGAEIGNSVIIPVDDAEIYTVAIFVNGESSAVPAWAPYYDADAWNILQSYPINMVVINTSVYYRSIQAVPEGTDITDTTYWEVYVPTLLTKVTLASTPGDADGIALVAFGIQAPTQYSWSTPQVQYQVVDATVISTGGFVLENSVAGTNPANMIVTVNGLRLTPPAGIEWQGDDSSTSFGLPQRLGSSFLQSTINAITDIQVYKNSQLQVQSFGATAGDYSVTNWDGSNTPGRQVVFNTAPAAGDTILISVSTLADYSLAGSLLQLNSIPPVDSIISVTTFNDTTQQSIATLVFVGPIVEGITIAEPYDSTDFDTGSVSGLPGSFDYSAGTAISKNDFYLDRPGIEAGRIWVTLDGYRLFEGQDYTVVDDYIILASGAIGTAQILAVTEFTESLVPEACAFRIFQDMRGVQGTYRITPATTTTLTQPLLAAGDTIHVADANACAEPNLPEGIFGVITIDGERIMYRERNVGTNTLTGLRRGTAGTGAADHETGAYVYDMSRGNLLAEQYQNYVVSDTSVGDGSTTIFYAPSIDISDFGDSSSIYTETIEVYVGGVRQYNYSDSSVPIEPGQYRWIVTDFEPLAIEFITDSNPIDPMLAPPPGVEITILQRRGLGWYGTGIKVNDGLALQETDTPQARFLTGRNGG